MKMGSISNEGVVSLRHRDLEVHRAETGTVLTGRPGIDDLLGHGSARKLRLPPHGIGVQIEAVVARGGGEVACPAHQGPSQTVPPVLALTQIRTICAVEPGG